MQNDFEPLERRNNLSEVIVMPEITAFSQVDITESVVCNGTHYEDAIYLNSAWIESLQRRAELKIAELNGEACQLQDTAQKDEDDWSDIESTALSGDDLLAVADYLLSTGQASS